MKKKKTLNSKYVQFQNRIRGAISKLKGSSKPGSPSTAWAKERAAYAEFNSVLAEARAHLEAQRFKSFEQWSTALLQLQHQNARRLGVALTVLGYIPTNIESSDLASELAQTTNRLYESIGELSGFVCELDGLAEAITNCDWDGAIKATEAICERHGYSYWAIETLLGLVQQARGADAVKAKISELAIGTSGANKFFLYGFGVRNEPSQAVSRFRLNFRKRIEELDVSAAFKAYCRYRLCGDLDPVSAKLAGLLSCENLTTLIDLFFSSLDVMRLIRTHQSAFSTLEVEGAERLYATLASLDVMEKIPGENGGEVAPAARERERSKVLFELAIRSVREAVAPSIEANVPIGSLGFLIRGIASQISTRDDGVAAEELSKYVLSFRWHPSSISVGNVSAIPALPNLFNESALTRTQIVSGVIDALKILAFENWTKDGRAVLADEDFTLMLEAMAADKGGRREECAALLERAASGGTSPIVQDAASVLLAKHYCSQDDLSACVRVCARAGMANRKLIPFLPLAELFQSAKWFAISRYSSGVDLAIALDHYLRVIDERKIKTYKRYAIAEVIGRVAASDVSQLPSLLVADGESLDFVEYFSYNVCDIASLELLPGVNGSRDVWSLRSNLLRNLANLHTSHELAYLTEAGEIDNGLEVDDGLFVLDDSKVYVDEQAVKRAIDSELDADFQRYLKLVKGGSGVATPLPELLKSFNNPSAELFQIPKSDADDLLIELVSTTLNKFLFDPASGLDIIVGRRIRHGTISSELRGVLETRNLIGHRLRAGSSYEPPACVNGYLGRLDPKQRKVVVSAFGRFSEAIDQIVATYRDEIFHVRSKSKPRGIFELQVSSILLALARTYAQSCSTISQFSKECIELFWFLLGTRLDAVRPNIERDLKKAIQQCFARLTSELRSLGVFQDEFFFHLQQAADELQRRASAISGWIRVPKASSEGRRYTMDRAVDFALAVIKGQRSGFEPALKSDLPPDLALDTHGLSIVCDALYIALDNIAQHSGIKRGGGVSLQVRFMPDESLVSFAIENELANGVRSAELEAKLLALRSDIQRRKFGERARLDKGSGLSKLAALVMQNEKTKMAFSINEKGWFSLKFDLIYISLDDQTVVHQRESQPALEIDAVRQV